MKFSTGVLLGTAIGASAAATMMTQTSKSSRKRMKKTGRRMMNKAEEVIDNIMDMV